ncbi:MAG: NYN domain-containing protein [Chloroflexota bacterium]
MHPQHTTQHDHHESARSERQEPSGAASEPQASLRRHDGQKRILVDAANVAFTNRNRPNDKGCVENIRAMRRALVELGYDPIFIADASLRFEVDEPEELNQLEQAGKILQAPAGTQADYFLLADAKRENLSIVSNDTFRDRKDEFPNAFKRRVPFMIVDGRVIVDRERLAQPVAARQ